MKNVNILLTDAKIRRLYARIFTDRRRDININKYKLPSHFNIVILLI